MEVWRNINDGYSVSDYGRVKSNERIVIRSNGRPHYVKEKILSQCVDDKGYLRCGIGKIHKLVAEAFVPNPNGYTVVHHKDHNQTNNRPTNLEWVDENTHNKMHSNLQKIIPPKVVYQYTLDGELVGIYSSTQEAAKMNEGYNFSNIARCCRGVQRTYKGYKWSYEPL